MPRSVELVLMALGAWTALMLAFVALLSAIGLCVDWTRRRADRRATDREAIDLLIQECRCPSTWIVAEPRGRG